MQLEAFGVCAVCWIDACSTFGGKHAQSQALYRQHPLIM